MGAEEEKAVEHCGNLLHVNVGVGLASVRGVYDSSLRGGQTAGGSPPVRRVGKREGMEEEDAEPCVAGVCVERDSGAVGAEQVDAVKAGRVSVHQRKSARAEWERRRCEWREREAARSA